MKHYGTRHVEAMFFYLVKHYIWLSKNVWVTLTNKIHVNLIWWNNIVWPSTVLAEQKIVGQHEPNFSVKQNRSVRLILAHLEHSCLAKLEEVSRVSLLAFTSGAHVSMASFQSQLSMARTAMSHEDSPNPLAFSTKSNSSHRASLGASPSKSILLIPSSNPIFNFLMHT